MELSSEDFEQRLGEPILPELHVHHPTVLVASDVQMDGDDLDRGAWLAIVHHVGGRIQMTEQFGLDLELLRYVIAHKCSSLDLSQGM